MGIREGLRGERWLRRRRGGVAGEGESSNVLRLAPFSEIIVWAVGYK